MSGTGHGDTRIYVGYDAYGTGMPPGAVPAPELGGTNPYILSNLSYTSAGNQRGNPENDDSYMYLTLSAYKKFNNSAKAYRTINMHQKRKIKASF